MIRLLGRGVLLFILGLALPLRAAAQDTYTLLDEAKIRTLLGDTLLAGEVVPEGEPWSECMQKDHTSFYRIGSLGMHGTWRIPADGRACFAYEDDDYREESCFSVMQKGQFYYFISTLGTYRVNYIEHGVTDCEDALPAIM